MDTMLTHLFWPLHETAHLEDIKKQSDNEYKSVYADKAYEADNDRHM